MLADLQREALIAVGTHIAGGSGTQPKVDQAVLFLWDYAAEEKVWEGTLDRVVATFNALVTGVDGRLYGTIMGGEEGGEIFVFDPGSCSFVERFALPAGRPLDLGLQVASDGAIYGFTTSCIYRFDPVDLSVEAVLCAEGVFSVGGPIIGDEIFFASGHRLRAVRLS